MSTITVKIVRSEYLQIGKEKASSGLFFSVDEKQTSGRCSEKPSMSLSCHLAERDLQF